MRRWMLALGAVSLGVAAYVAVRPVREVKADGATLCFEAEKGTLEEPFKKATEPKTDKKPGKPQKSSGTYIYIPDKANGGKKKIETLPGKATFKVKAKTAGQYYFYARTLWPSGCGNSFYIRKAGGSNHVLGQDGTYNVWHWVKLPEKLVLAAGENVIVVGNREDGVLMDQIFMTTTDRVPQGAEKVTEGALNE